MTTLLRALACAIAALSVLGGCREGGQDDDSNRSAVADPPPGLRLVRTAGSAEPTFVEVDRDGRWALELAPDAELGLGTADGAPALPEGTRIAFDAVAVARDAGRGGTHRLLATDAAGRAHRLELATTWSTFVVEAGGSLDGFSLAVEADDPAAATVHVANPRIVDPTRAQPTVLLITSDTHRADHVSAINAASPVATPYIDALARRGALFTNCFAAINTTNPSHVALMTGIHPRDTKVVNNSTRLHVSAQTLAEHFRDAGYQTFAALSAFHLFDDVSGLGQGFDRMSAPASTTRDGSETLAIAREWIDDAEGAPLFLWLHLFDVHTPYELPEEDMSRLLAERADPFRDTASLGVDEEYVPSWLRETGLRDPEFVAALYAGEVRYLDGILGPFLEHPRLTNASIAFTADHGEALGEQDVWWDHFGLVDPTIHVPLVLHGPGATGGARSAAPVRQIDVGRTLLDMAGLEDVAFPGRDVRESLGEHPPLEPRFALSGEGIAASVELDGWMLELYLRDIVVHTSGREHVVGETSLYHLPTDPRCAEDRLLDEFERAMRLREAVIDWLESAEVTGLTDFNQEVPPEVTAKLAELGYSGGLESVYRWWTPDHHAEDWESSPWNVAFQGEGDPDLLRDAIRTESGGR